MRHFNLLYCYCYCKLPFVSFSYFILFFLLPSFSPDFPLFQSVTLISVLRQFIAIFSKLIHLLLLNLNFNTVLFLCIITSLYLLFAFNAVDNDFKLLTYAIIKCCKNLLKVSFSTHTHSFALLSIELKCYSSQCINNVGKNYFFFHPKSKKAAKRKRLFLILAHFFLDFLYCTHYIYIFTFDRSLFSLISFCSCSTT